MISRAVLFLLLPLAADTARCQLRNQEEILRFSQIKTNMRRHLDGMPNYTCLQTVERYHRAPRAKREELIDVLRLEVAYVAGRELFAWPGSSTFDDRELRDLISTGAFSTGSFALHARALFFGEAALFQFIGEETMADRAAWRFDYSTPRVRSGYQVRNPTKRISANVAYHGSFWADKTSGNLIRLTIQTDEIPSEIEIEQASDRLDYQLVKIASIDALLPRQSELHVLDAKGYESINRIRLSRCKQYATESSISFEDPAEVLAKATSATRQIQLPSGLEVELALDQPIEFSTSAVGDAIEATLRRDIRVGKEVIAAKGSRARGRILQLQHSNEDFSIFNITLLFEDLSGDGWRAPLKIGFVRTDPPPRLPAGLNPRGRMPRSIPVPRTGENGFLIFADKLKLPRGFTTIWETR